MVAVLHLRFGWLLQASGTRDRNLDAGNAEEFMSQERAAKTFHVQFEIQRECPEPGDVPTNLAEYPVAVFVEWPPFHRGDNISVWWCSSPHMYRLRRDEALRLGYDTRSDWWICEHMGRLIE
jgi:hypothetical protein